MKAQAPPEPALDDVSIQTYKRLVFNVVWRQDGLPWDAESVKAAQNDGIEIGGMLVANAELVKE